MIDRNDTLGTTSANRQAYPLGHALVKPLQPAFQGRSIPLDAPSDTFQTAQTVAVKPGAPLRFGVSWPWGTKANVRKALSQQSPWDHLRSYNNNHMLEDWVTMLAGKPDPMAYTEAAVNFHKSLRKNALNSDKTFKVLQQVDLADFQKVHEAIIGLDTASQFDFSDTMDSLMTILANKSLSADGLKELTGKILSYDSQVAEQRGLMALKIAVEKYSILGTSEERNRPDDHSGYLDKRLNDFFDKLFAIVMTLSPYIPDDKLKVLLEKNIANNPDLVQLQEMATSVKGLMGEGMAQSPNRPVYQRLLENIYDPQKLTVAATILEDYMESGGSGELLGNFLVSDPFVQQMSHHMLSQTFSTLGEELGKEKTEKGKRAFQQAFFKLWPQRENVSMENFYRTVHEVAKLGESSSLLGDEKSGQHVWSYLLQKSQKSTSLKEAIREVQGFLEEAETTTPAGKALSQVLQEFQNPATLMQVCQLVKNYADNKGNPEFLATFLLSKPIIAEMTAPQLEAQLGGLPALASTFNKPGDAILMETLLEILWNTRSQQSPGKGKAENHYKNVLPALERLMPLAQAQSNLLTLLNDKPFLTENILSLNKEPEQQANYIQHIGKLSCLQRTHKSAYEILQKSKVPERLWALAGDITQTYAESGGTADIMAKCLLNLDTQEAMFFVHDQLSLLAEKIQRFKRENQLPAFENAMLAAVSTQPKPSGNFIAAVEKIALLSQHYEKTLQKTIKDDQTPLWRYLIDHAESPEQLEATTQRIQGFLSLVSRSDQTYRLLQGKKLALPQQVEVANIVENYAQQGGNPEFFTTFLLEKAKIQNATAETLQQCFTNIGALAAKYEALDGKETFEKVLEALWGSRTDKTGNGFLDVVDKVSELSQKYPEMIPELQKWNPLWQYMLNQGNEPLQVEATARKIDTMMHFATEHAGFRRALFQLFTTFQQPDSLLTAVELVQHFTENGGNPEYLTQFMLEREATLKKRTVGDFAATFSNIGPLAGKYASPDMRNAFRRAMEFTWSYWDKNIKLKYMPEAVDIATQILAGVPLLLKSEEQWKYVLGKLLNPPSAREIEEYSRNLKTLFSGIEDHQGFVEHLHQNFLKDGDFRRAMVIKQILLDFKSVGIEEVPTIHEISTNFDPLNAIVKKIREHKADVAANPKLKTAFGSLLKNLKKDPWLPFALDMTHKYAENSGDPVFIANWLLERRQKFKKNDQSIEDYNPTFMALSTIAAKYKTPAEQATFSKSIENCWQWIAKEQESMLGHYADMATQIYLAFPATLSDEKKWAFIKNTVPKTTEPHLLSGYSVQLKKLFEGLEKQPAVVELLLKNLETTKDFERCQLIKNTLTDYIQSGEPNGSASDLARFMVDCLTQDKLPIQDAQALWQTILDEGAKTDQPNLVQEYTELWKSLESAFKKPEQRMVVMNILVKAGSQRKALSEIMTWVQNARSSKESYIETPEDLEAGMTLLSLSQQPDAFLDFYRKNNERLHPSLLFHFSRYLMETGATGTQLGQKLMPKLLGVVQPYNESLSHFNVNTASCRDQLFRTLTLLCNKTVALGEPMEFENLGRMGQMPSVFQHLKLDQLRAPHGKSGASHPLSQILPQFKPTPPRVDDAEFGPGLAAFNPKTGLSIEFRAGYMVLSQTGLGTLVIRDISRPENQAKSPALYHPYRTYTGGGDLFYPAQDILEPYRSMTFNNVLNSILYENSSQRPIYQKNIKQLLDALGETMQPALAKNLDKLVTEETQKEATP